jgi:hypothetical protein
MFPVRYELNLYILCRRNRAVKEFRVRDILDGCAKRRVKLFSWLIK